MYMYTYTYRHVFTYIMYNETHNHDPVTLAGWLKGVCVTSTNLLSIKVLTICFGRGGGVLYIFSFRRICIYFFNLLASQFFSLLLFPFVYFFVIRQVSSFFSLPSFANSAFFSSLFSSTSFIL